MPKRAMLVMTTVWACALLTASAPWAGGAEGRPRAVVKAAKPKQLVVLDVPAPSLSGREDDWLTGDGRPVAFEPGKVYVVHFWTFGCINCKHNLPAYMQWYGKYAGKPFEMIGVHTPETDAERDAANVRRAVRENGIEYPVLIDGRGENWDRWQQHWWPTVYLIDKRGHVRYYWTGELEWEGAGGTKIMEGYLDALLKEPSPVPERKRVDGEGPNRGSGPRGDSKSRVGVGVSGTTATTRGSSGLP